MNEKIQVLGLKIDNLTAKEAVKEVVSYMGTEPMNVVEMVTMNTLGKFRDDESAGEIFELFELALASDKGILQAAGVADEKRLKEVEDLLFIKMILRVFHKNGTKVFLLTENHEDLEKLITYMNEDYANIQVIETATMSEQGVSDDMLLNIINGAEVECVISALASPSEELFVGRNKMLINAKVWLGLGNLLDEMRKPRNTFQKVKDLIMRLILKKEMAKKGENA